MGEGIVMEFLFTKSARYVLLKVDQKGQYKLLYMDNKGQSDSAVNAQSFENGYQGSNCRLSIDGPIKVCVLQAFGRELERSTLIIAVGQTHPGILNSTIVHSYYYLQN